MKITEYDQLKHGMKVKFSHNSVVAKGVLYEEDGRYYLMQNVTDSLDDSSPNDMHGFKYAYDLGESDFDYINTLDYLETYEKTLDDLEEGDVLVGDDGDFTKVLGVCGQVVFITGYESSIEQLNSNAHHSTWTVPQLKEVGFTVYQPEETEDVIVTLDEIAKLKGVDVSKIKIKK